ncbi:Protein pelota -like protein [Halotydeus destructor]|nr:Protein pelota -like protein [Halotydeus destructor]
MKLLFRQIDRDGKGHVGLVPEEAEDMWHTYNLVQVHDSIRASTIRKVTLESVTGTTASNKVRTTLKIAIEQIEYDTQACVLRVKGRNVEENQYVKMGAYHTIDLEMNRKFVLFKTDWDSIALERIETACDPTQNSDLAAIVMQEGLANICLIMSSMTLTRAKIEVNIPRKRRGNCAQHEKGLTKFYDQIIQAIVRHINFDVVKCILVASPGFVKDHFFEYMMLQAVKLDMKVLIENRNKFTLTHSSSGFKHSLKEILTDPLIQSKLVDTKAAGEVRALEDFYKMLHHEPSKAFYGIKHVEKANEFEAIDRLLISDNLFRNQDPVTRRRYVALVDSVREKNGDVKLFSSLHPSGEQLDQLTGVAAILRFPVPELEDEGMSSSDGE